MNVYPVTVKLNEEVKTISLRLDANHIRQLCADRCDITELLGEAPQKPWVMADLLGAAADYKGNQNPTVSGDDLFDALVESGFSGPVKWTELACHLAAVSGIFQKEYATAIVSKTSRGIQAALDALNADAEPEVAVDDPSTAAEQLNRRSNG